MKALKNHILLKKKRHRKNEPFENNYETFNKWKKIKKFKRTLQYNYRDENFVKLDNINNQSKNQFPYDNNYKFFSTTIKKDVLIFSNENNIINKIEKIMEQENSNFIYRRKVIKYFNNFINFLEKNSKTTETKIKIHIREDKKIIYSITEINLSDVYNFVHSNYNKYKDKTKNIILSIMRKFTRILNNKPDLNYEQKLNFHKSHNNSLILNDNELNSIVNYLKDNDELEALILFYFLYFSGLNFYSLSRCQIKDFQKDFEILKIIKDKVKKIHIPLVIKRNIKQFLLNRDIESKFLFIEYYNEKENIKSRATYLKDVFIKSIKLFKGFSEQKKNILIKDFSITRKYKILTEKYFQLFDFDFRIIDDESIPNLFSPSRDKSKFNFSASKLDENEEKSKISNEE